MSPSGRARRAGRHPGPGALAALPRLVVAVVFLSAIGAVLAGQWRQARPLLGGLDAPVLLASWALVLAGIYATFRSWRAVLADLGGGPRPRPCASSTWASWASTCPAPSGRPSPRCASAATTGSRREPRARPSGSSCSCSSAPACWLPVIPLLGRDAADEYRWLALVVPLFALALSPPLLNRVIAVALRAARRPPMPRR